MCLWHTAGPGGKNNNKTPTGGDDRRSSGGGRSATRSAPRRRGGHRRGRSNSAGAPSPTGAGGGGDGGEAAVAALAGAMASLRDRVGGGKSSLDALSPQKAAAEEGGDKPSGEREKEKESGLWPFLGLGDSPPRSRTGSTTIGGQGQGLFSR